ncbi:MAG: DMT family transporter [Alphaproteobacteria bacterium]
MHLLSIPLRGALLALASFFAYACTDVSIKALGHGMSAFQVMFLAALCTIPPVLMQIFWVDRKASLRPALPGLTALRVVISVIGSAFVTYTFTHLPLEQCYAVFFTMPLIITVLAWPLLGEPIDPLRGVIILIGFVGVLIALQPGSTSFQLAHLAAVGGAITGALNSLILRKIGHREKAGVILLYPVLAQLLGAGLIMPFVWQPLTAADWYVGIQMGFLGTAGGLFIIAAYRTAPAIVVAPMQYSQIIWASLLGYVLWGERPTLYTTMGIAVIVAAGMALLFVAGRRAPSLSAA